MPPWLLVNKALIPDFVVKDPKVKGSLMIYLTVFDIKSILYWVQDAPIWEITGAEFTSSNLHTAGGISIRFPRVTRIRDDKDWTDATDLERLKVCYNIQLSLFQEVGIEGFPLSLFQEVGME